MNKNNKNNISTIKKTNETNDTRKSYEKKSIKNSNYIRPELTYTDLLTKEQIETLLIDFEEIKDIETIPIGTFIRYFEQKEGELKFRVGGILSVKKPEEGYIYLKNNQINWPVQLKTCILFRKLTTQEVRKEFDLKLLEKEKENNHLISLLKKQQNDINKLKKDIEKYKQLINKLKN